MQPVLMLSVGSNQKPPPFLISETQYESVSGTELYSRG